ncbi:hypothetical protein [Nocardiopsis sp. LOL_012]|uniref:hypothetical protein n=1 Tax=Nocardiopsis sp. LOL_012 TaxID=3345409 RepID=UPI003A85DBD2
MTERILSAAQACLAWARRCSPPVAVDADALVFLLSAHRDAGASDPGDWTVADVRDIARTVRGWDRTPDTLRDTWLAWCDHLVAADGLTSRESPRRLRSAIAAVGLVPDGPAEATADGIALPLLNRLDAGDGGFGPLPPVVPAAAEELDAAARACPPLAEAAGLAAWVGGGRPLDTGAEHDALTGHDTAEAAAALGIRPEGVRRGFDAALAAGLLRRTYTRVLPGHTVLEGGGAGTAADAWADALLSMARAPAATVLLSLMDLFVAGEPRPAARIVDTYGGGAVAAGGPGTADQVGAALEDLATLGAVAPHGGGAFRITPLGDHFAVRRLRQWGAEVALTPPLERMEAEHALTVAEKGRRVDAEGLLARWTAVRGAAPAAQELLEAAADPGDWHRRRLAVSALGGVEGDLEPVLGMYAHHPVLGGWVRRLRGTDTGADTSHQAVWALLDGYAILLDAGRPLPGGDGERYAGRAGDLVRTVSLTGHPAAEEVLDRLAGGALGPRVAAAARQV